MSSWHELVVQGPEGSFRAFVVGFLAGRGERDGGIFGSDVDLEPESLGERLKGLFRVGSHHVFLAPERIALALENALVERGPEVKLRFERRRVVEAMAFTFRAEVFSRELAKEIRSALLDSLPSSVRVESLSESEEIDPKAHGPEPFAPLHEYVYRVSGRILGPIEDALPVWRRSHDRDFVEISSLAIVTS